MPSSLKRVRSRALVYSTHPPVSVCGTGTLVCARFFLGCDFEESTLAVALASPCGTRMFNTSLFSITTSIWFKCRWCRNINLLVIIYAIRPRLRTRLTLGGRTLPRKPWVYGGREFNPSYRYSCLHPHFQTLHSWLPSCFTAFRTLPYHSSEPEF